MVQELVSYALARLNIRRTTAINENICPKVLFTGMKINFEKELDLEFGRYTEVYDGTDNTSKSRSIPCIALYPCSNSTGSWEFMNLKTKTRVRRSYWKKMKQSELIVEFMQKFDEKAELPAVVEPVLEQEPPQSMDTSTVDPLVEGQAEDSEQAQVVELEDPSVVEQEQVKISEEQVLETEPESPVASHTRQQVGKSILKPSKYSMATKLDKKTEKSPQKLAAIKKAEVKEIKQLFENLEAVEAVHENDVKGHAHGCHMFVFDKHLVDGIFDKCKGHVVLHGNEQDPEMYPDRSSPTVAIHSIFACLTVAAHRVSKK